MIVLACLRERLLGGGIGGGAAGRRGPWAAVGLDGLLVELENMIHIHICTYIYVYIYIYTCIYICVYIYIYRERESKAPVERSSRDKRLHTRNKHTCHILPPSEIDLGLCLAVLTSSGGKYLFHRIG